MSDLVYHPFSESGNSKRISNTYQVINIKDIIYKVSVSSHIFKKDKHQPHEIHGKFMSILSSGEFVQEVIPLYFCKTCNEYYVLNNNLSLLNGHPLCIIKDLESKSRKTDNVAYEYAGYHKKSILRIYGYSISKQANLSSIQRKKLLSILVDNKIQSRSEIEKLLSFLLTTRGYVLSDAWQEDINYIINYENGSTINNLPKTLRLISHI